SEESGLRPAIIFGAAVNALSYVRSLGRRSVPVISAETYRGVAARSRYGLFVQLERSGDDEIAGERDADQLVRRFNDAGIEPVVFGSADQWQMYLAQRSEMKGIGIRSLVPTPSIMDRIVDKQAQYE